MTELSEVFNSPIETGLRCLAILESGYPNSYDIERIIYYDYMLVHSGDIQGGPESIHPNTPHRSGEVLVKRPVIEKGLKAMIARGLIEVDYSNSGIEYIASDLATPFLESLRENYTVEMLKVADWVTAMFDDQDITFIKKTFTDNLNNWGGEFLNESIIRGERF